MLPSHPGNRVDGQVINSLGKVKRHEDDRGEKSSLKTLSNLERERGKKKTPFEMGHQQPSPKSSIYNLPMDAVYRLNVSGLLIA